MSAHKDRLPQASIYGFHAVRGAWLNPARDIKALYITAQAQSGFHGTLAEAGHKGLPRPAPTLIEKSQLEKMLPRGAVHQGIALAANRLEETFIQDLIIKTDRQKHSILLMLDQVTDPHNVGAIIRSACAFGADGLIMQRKTAPELSGVLAKAACGGIEHMPVALETNLSRAIETLQRAGFFVYGLDEHGERTIADLQATGKIVLVLGAEGDGMRHLVRQHCDELVRLPTGGPIASLNVSNAAAVALYALCASR